MKKDKEWLTNEIEIMESETSENYPHEQMVEREVILNLIDQLDESEALSQKWIDNNSINASHDGVTDEYVHVGDLENLLVPKQKLPVVPKYVAEFIEEVKASGDRLDDAFSILRDIYHQSKTADWVAKENRNSETFARAWLDGYEVGEQKYCVINNENYFLLAKDKEYGFVFSTGGNSRLGDSENSSTTFELTEQEIKDYDERYWSFAVLVEWRNEQ